MDESAEMVKVRRAVSGDSAAIEALYRDLTKHPDVTVLPEQIVAMGESERSFLLVADANGRTLGPVLLSICQDAMYARQPFGVIENIVVAPDAHAKGIGRALINAVEDLATAQ